MQLSQLLQSPVISYVHSRKPHSQFSAAQLQLQWLSRVLLSVSQSESQALESFLQPPLSQLSFSRAIQKLMHPELTSAFRFHSEVAQLIASFLPSPCHVNLTALII